MDLHGNMKNALFWRSGIIMPICHVTLIHALNPQRDKSLQGVRI